MSNTGKVYLVGAGPGDPGLITVAGMRRLESADVVVYDRLVDKRLISRSRQDAEVIDVGKKVGEGRDAQKEISNLLVAKAKAGRNVVRLKGGDPFVFGRGGEEAEVLSDAGVPFVVVPGVSSAVAAPAYAGIPVTHRKLASSVTIVTGAVSRGSNNIDWRNLANCSGTLIVLMGWDNLDEIVSALMDAGRDASTPVALVQWGSESYQRTVVGTLGDIQDIAVATSLGPPIVVVVGEVVNLRDKLRWFDRGSLFGKRVLVTRSGPQSGSLSQLLADEGAYPVEFPTIQIQRVEDNADLDECIGLLDNFDWIVFPSSNAVGAVFARLNELGMDSRAFHTVKVAAIGSVTASELLGHGITPDFTPEGFVSESVVEGLGSFGVQGLNVLIPGALVRRDTMFRGLECHGATVREVGVYSNSVPVGASDRLAEVLEGGIDVVTFTSGSTVRNLVQILEGDVSQINNSVVASIGPVTSEVAREAGLSVRIEAGEHTISGLVDAIRIYAER